MLKVETEGFEDLMEHEKGKVSNNGGGKKYATYIRVKQDGDTILLESDAMEPEDALFSRDLGWIPKIIQKAYEIGKMESR